MVALASTMLHHSRGPADPPTLAESLERGGIHVFDPCPFPLPADDERRFLCEQRVRRPFGRCTRYDVRTDRVRGCATSAALDLDRLRGILARAADHASTWLVRELPHYAGGLELDAVAFHSEEEATRKVRFAQRNDLLHIDASPHAPTHDRRLLRLFVNLHPSDPRVWLTSLNFVELLNRHADIVGVAPDGRQSWRRSLRRIMSTLLRSKTARAPYDDFLLRFRDFLKRNDAFQDRSIKRCWHFSPGTAWLLFTDGLSHAELRGRYVLEFAYFIGCENLVCPELAPAALFNRACQEARNRQANSVHA
jgi:3-deoxy-D-manno-octulosonic acid hydroxylase-like protein